jgi:hypothetical protein
MLRVYRVTSADLAKTGYHGPLDEALRFDQFVQTDPQNADVIVVPLSLREGPEDLNRHRLRGLVALLGQPEEKFAAFDCSDYEEMYPDTPNAMFIRCNLKGWMRRAMPRSIPWAWPVENFKDIMALPEGGFKYDVSGHMWLSSNVRISACEEVKKAFGDKADIVTRTEFYGYIERDDKPRADKLKADFKRSMQESRVSLCPRSIAAVFPYRFFEAMSAGRIPALFCDDYCLPWEKEIPYRDFCIMAGDQDTPSAGQIIKDWLAGKSDAEIIERGKVGRQYFERYLNRENCDALFREAIENQLRKEGRIV